MGRNRRGSRALAALLALCAPIVAALPAAAQDDDEEQLVLMNEPGSFTDPACDEGPRRLACGPGVRRALQPLHKEAGLGLRIVR